MLAGTANAVFTLPTGWPAKKGRLPIWPTRMTTVKITYIENARTIRPGVSAGTSAPGGRPDAPPTRRGPPATTSVSKW